MDIEDRAQRYAVDHAPTRLSGTDLPPEHHAQLVEILRDAYLAGSAQTQADYTAFPDPAWPPPGSSATS